MFTGFSEDAIEVVNRAEQHAAELDSDHVGAEHILLGLLSRQSGLGGQVLRALGFSDQSVRQRLKASNGAARDDADLPSPGRFERLGDPLIAREFTPRARSVLEYAVREALVLGGGSIGSEHILLGLSRQDGGLAMAVLKEIDAEMPRSDQEEFDRNHLGLEFRNAVIRALSESRHGKAAP